MSEFTITIFNDLGFQSVVVVFSGLFLTFYFVGFSISLIVRLLYKIIRLKG